MASSSNIGPVSQQYSAAATVPLIKSPSLWLPQPVELPNDIHPLPEDITAYFVYPFTLENHVLSQRPAAHEAIAQRRARNAAVLHQREVEEEQRERDALHRIAPGYNPSGLLVPLSASPAPSSLTNGTLGTSSSGVTGAAGSAAVIAAPPDPLDDLVAKLEEMESKRA